MATLIGIVLYIGLSHIYTLFDFGVGFIVIFPGLLIPLLLGMRFGPWTGLITGGGGFFISEWVKPYWYWRFGSVTIGYASPIGWSLIICVALLGFVAGLTILITRGRYNTRNIVIADSIIALSVFLGLGFAILIPFSYWLDFIELALPTSIFVLIFLPILLIIYNAIEKSRRSA